MRSDETWRYTIVGWTVVNAIMDANVALGTLISLYIP
jgi:hypothetical protein